MKSAKTNPTPSTAGTITTETAAQLLMVTPGWVRKLTTDGWIAKVGIDQYRIVDVVQGCLRHLRDENRRASQSAAGKRVQDARAAEIELRTAERTKIFEARGHQAASDTIDAMFLPLRNDLYAIPARVTADLVLRQKIEDELDAAIAACGERAAALAAKITAGPAADVSKGKVPRKPRKRVENRT